MKHINLQPTSIRISLCIALASMSMLLAAQSSTVEGPDGKLKVHIELKKGIPSYQVQYDNKCILEPSPLGLQTTIGNFTSGLTELSGDTREINESYTLNHGKCSTVHYTARELVKKYLNINKDTLSIIFRISKNDVAFCYRISSPNKKNTTIVSEATGFKLPQGTTTYISPQSNPGIGWMKTKPSYEERYTNNEPIGTRSAYGQGYTFPALFKTKKNAWILISETGVDSHYVGTHLTDATPDGLYRIAFPMKGENRGIGDTYVHTILPATTSWKTLSIGTDLKPIVESTVATDVVNPLYEAKHTYEPGNASWSWILWQDQSMNWNDQVAFIDMIAEAGFKYILIDALWDTQIGYERMPELIKYAHSKKVECLLWYNSNGAWNDAPQGPRGKLDSAPTRQREFAWLQSLGVRGLKIDFFGGDKQVTMKLYEDLLTDANNAGLALIFHGCTLPRGWERMYPNYISSEAVLASENLVFGQDHADQAAWNSTIIPFTRNAVAAMDYGPVFLSPRYSKSDNKGTIRRTTDTYELATAITYFAPIQHYGIVPNDLKRQPRWVIDFLRDLPTTWDETRLLGGTPGEYVVMARRKGDHWYIAATNGSNEPRRIEFNLPEEMKGNFLLISDNKHGKAQKGEGELNRKGSIRLNLQGNGGAVLLSK